MVSVVKICGAISLKDEVGWNEDTQAVTITNDVRTLEGKAVYDYLFTEATDYILLQIISGDNKKVLEIDALLKDAGIYADRYEEMAEEKAAVVQEIKEPDEDVSEID